MTYPLQLFQTLDRYADNMVNEDIVYDYIRALCIYIEGEEWEGHVSEDKFLDALILFDKLVIDNPEMRGTKNPTEEAYYIRELYSIARVILPKPRAFRRIRF